MALTTINSGGVKDDSIVNADIKSDAAIALSKLASTPAVLTGSTNNTITTVTGANAIQGEANLTFDGTLLTVNGGSSDTPLIINATNAGGPHLRFQQDGSTKHFVGCGTGIGGLGDKDDLTIRAYDNIFLATNNTSTARLTIDAAGEVGIGTTPTTILDVRDTSTTSYPFTSSDSGTYSYTPYAHELNLRNNTAGTDDGFAGIHFHAGERSEGGRQGTARISALYTGEYKADLVFATRNVSFKERLRITSDGKLSIGTDTPHCVANGVHIKSNDSGVTSANANRDEVFIEGNDHTGITIATPNDKVGGIGFDDPDGAGRGRIQYAHGSDMMYIYTSGSPRHEFTEHQKIIDGNLIIGTSGHGINFHNYGTGTDIDSNLLNDYEEGTWIPTANTNLTLHSTYHRWSYTKIGRQVTIRGLLLPSAVSGTDAISVTLPFVSANETGLGNAGGVGTMFSNITGATAGVASFIGNNMDEMRFYILTEGSGWARMANDDISTSSEIYFSHTYFAA